MKIIRINELTETNRQVEFTGGTSFRALVASDNMGFAMMKTVIPKGGPHHWHYQHHLEACYCIKGKGELVNLETGLRVLIVPDMVYAMDKNDDHTFEALEDLYSIPLLPAVNRMTKMEFINPKAYLLIILNQKRSQRKY
jgi:L-ectoine synthase